MLLPVRLEVVAGAQGPLVRKVAETALGRQRIQGEIARLERSRHPGVVELLGASEAELVLAWAGTDTLATSRPALPVAAGILASVASTIADLHEVGIVHGRLDPSHVVLGGDGRPRLCGLRGADDAPAPPTPADDVEALGRLIDHLLGGDAEAEPIPERRWTRTRWSGYSRRGLLTLADQAADPDPARRPTARSLAAAIAETVPEAHLAPPAVVERARAPIATDTEGQTSELRAIDHDLVPAPATEAEPLDPVDPVDPEVVDTDRRVLGLRIEPGTSDVDGAPSGPPLRPRPLGTGPVGSARTVRRSRLLPIAVAAGVLLVAAVAVRARPGPPAETAGPPAEVVVAPVASSSVPASITPTSGPATSQPAASTTPGATTTSAAACPSPVAEGGADVDGDGCTEPVSVLGNRITADGTTFEIGAVGDAVAIGDWDCDGVATPGVVRPASGEVFLFDRWTTDTAAVTVRATTVVPGARTVEAASPAGTDGCTGTVVRLADGTTQDIVPGTSP